MYTVALQDEYLDGEAQHEARADGEQEEDEGEDPAAEGVERVRAAELAGRAAAHHREDRHDAADAEAAAAGVRRRGAHESARASIGKVMLAGSRRRAAAAARRGDFLGEHRLPRRSPACERTWLFYRL